MLAQSKILLLDDDQGFLDLYQEMLSRHLPSLPEVRTANSGARGLAVLETEAFNILVVDLNMPKMDGLQVLSIARRKYPQTRLVVLTAMREEQFRNRAYAMGVDQYWIKPESDREMGLFMESLESLLHHETQGGFRGVQSKSLVDIIQLECLSQNSTLLRITNGHAEGRIWITQGEVIDAEAQEITAEPAFQRILGWKAGSFEMLPSDPNRPRTIFTSYQGLLLNTAQAIDEAASLAPAGKPAVAGGPPTAGAAVPKLAEFGQLPGVEFVLTIAAGDKKRQDYWGLENPAPTAEWTHRTIESFRSLGEHLQVGALQQVIGTSTHRKMALAICNDTHLCVGFPAGYATEQMRETLKWIRSKWES